MRTFRIKTRTNSGTYIFLTKGNNGKEALLNLINHSSDYKNILKKQESNSMVIDVDICNKNKKRLDLRLENSLIPRNHQRSKNGN